MVVLLISKQSELINIQIEKLKKAKLDEINEFTYAFYDGNFVAFQDVLDELETVSFFNKRMVTIKNFDKKDIPLLKKFLKENDSEDATLVLTFNELDKKDELYHLIKNNGQIIEINDVDKKDEYKVVKKMFESKEVKIDEEALNEFLNRVDFDLTLIKNEILKLKALEHKVSLEDVKNLVSRKIDDNVFDILDGILKEDYEKSLQTYNDLVKRGYKASNLIPIIASSLRFIYQIKCLASKNNSNDEIANILKVHPYRVKVNLKNSYSYSKDDIMALLDELFNIDYNIKTGKISDDQALTLFILRREGY